MNILSHIQTKIEIFKYILAKLKEKRNSRDRISRLNKAFLQFIKAIF